MSTITKNCGFIKPELQDPANITDMNGNWDKLDTLIPSGGAAPIGLCKTIYTAANDAADITQLNSILEAMGHGEYGGQAVVYAICKREYSIDQTPMHSWLYRIENIHNLYARVEATTSLGNGHKMQRVRFNGEWLPWEHINPALLIGQEYRTTERWLEKPVYTTMISCGTVTTGKNTTPTGISGITVVVKYAAHIGGIPLPYLPNGLSATDGYFATAGVQDDNIYLNVGSALNGKSAYVQIWYTKE